MESHKAGCHREVKDTGSGFCLGLIVVCVLNFLLCSVCVLFRKSKRFFLKKCVCSVLSVKGILSCGLMNPIYWLINWPYYWPTNNQTILSFR